MSVYAMSEGAGILAAAGALLGYTLLSIAALAGAVQVRRWRQDRRDS
jgi:hypothetical protein